MDYALIKAFVTIAQTGSLTRAAERLCMTQPALSLQLKKLQDSLGLVLFKRTPRGMQLTDEGRRLLASAEQALESATAFQSAAAGLKGMVHGELKIGTIVDPEFLRLGPFLQAMASHHPGLTYELRHGISGAVLREVESGALDVAFTLGFPGLTDMQARFSVLALTDFHYRVIAPPGWKSQVKGKDWQALCALPWIATPVESVHHRLLQRVFTELSLEPNVVAKVDVESSMMDLVHSGVALALARDSLALQASHEQGIVIADQVSLEASLGLVCRKDRISEPPIQAAMEIVKAVWS
ncbi:Transcriptional regulator, LysR family [Nitrincola lacisaponensis]|uniref:Transcriptional regulator, LysR family n=1 Tax=Nitrincola lacisaponensis TaxID=267850 RepID=A0A063Y718_9GAMM|nr:LysR family transcriptional regulator [Nitrincola lacisaponensis]KDE40920.1 Transcriptional regulator, LysR family [Nitrincola lacisaponensis]